MRKLLMALMIMFAMAGLVIAAEVTVSSYDKEKKELKYKDADDKEEGVVVKDVLPNGPAATAGLKAGDRLLTLSGRWTDTLIDLYTAAGYVKPGETAAVTVRRDGQVGLAPVTCGGLNQVHGHDVLSLCSRLPDEGSRT